MTTMTLYDYAARLVDEVRERPGGEDDPFILWCLESTPLGIELHDEIPWCSAFVNRCAWHLRLPRSKRANARSWLDIGEAVNLQSAEVGNDVVVLKRGANPIEGHVGIFAGIDADGIGIKVRVLGGNQSNSVTIASFPIDDVLGVRRLRS